MRGSLEDPPPPTAFARAIALFGLAYLAIATVATLRPTPLLWGVHAPAFLSSPAQVATLGALTLGTALVGAAALRRGWLRRAEGRRLRLPPSLKRLWPWLGLAVWGTALWALRTRSYLLGDQALWITRLREGTEVVYSEPLAALAWRGFRFLLLQAGAPIEPPLLAILPVLCGLIAVPLCLQIGREVAGRSHAGWYAACVLLAGTSQIYFGYIEAYALVSLALLTYLWLVVRFANGRGSALPAGIGLGLAVSSHLACSIFIPSYLFLVFRQPASRAARAMAIGAPVALVLGVFAVASFGSRELLHPIRLVGSALGSAAGPQIDPASVLRVALRVALDLANWLLLSALVPTLLLAASLIARPAPRPPVSPAHFHLGLASLSGLLLSATLCLPGTPAQDWDLLTIGALPTILFGIAEGLKFLERAENRVVRVGLATLSLGGLAGFVLTNADPSAGLRRFETLMSGDAMLSAHERAYGNEKLADYHASIGNRPEALRFAHRALAADSANARYWGKVGQALYQLERYSEAAPYFHEAVRRGAPPGPAYYYLGYAHIRMGDPEKAARYLWEAVRADPNQPVYWSALGLALVTSGQAERGRLVWEQVLTRWPNDGETRAAYRMVFGGEPSSGAVPGPSNR